MAMQSRDDIVINGSEIGQLTGNGEVLIQCKYGTSIISTDDPDKNGYILLQNESKYFVLGDGAGGESTMLIKNQSKYNQIHIAVIDIL